MIELIATIALLCQVDANSFTPRQVARYQLECQQEYLKCVKRKYSPLGGFSPDRLNSCILEKK